jgi:hypothetical protein
MQASNRLYQQRGTASRPVVVLLSILTLNNSQPRSKVRSARHPRRPRTKHQKSISTRRLESRACSRSRVLIDGRNSPGRAVLSQGRIDQFSGPQEQQQLKLQLQLRGVHVLGRMVSGNFQLLRKMIPGPLIPLPKRWVSQLATQPPRRCSRLFARRIALPAQ